MLTVSRSVTETMVALHRVGGLLEWVLGRYFQEGTAARSSHRAGNTAELQVASRRIGVYLPGGICQGRRVIKQQRLLSHAALRASRSAAQEADNRSPAQK